MQNPATISLLHVVPAPDPAPVKPLLTPEEEKLIALIASIAVDQTLKQAYEKSNSLSEVQ
jgi:hypothetical protein